MTGGPANSWPGHRTLYDDKKPRHARAQPQLVTLSWVARPEGLAEGRGINPMKFQF